MKTLFNFKTLLVSLSVSMFISCTNSNAPEMSSTFTALANDALATSVGESTVIEADASINTFIKSAGAQKSIGIIPSNDPDSAEDAANQGYPKVTRISDKDVYPCEYVLDYGDKGFISKSKLKYKGQVHFIVSDISSKKKVYKFTNFSINDKQVECTKTVEVVAKGVLHIVTEETSKAKNGNDTYRYSERTRTKIDPNNSVKVGDGDNDLDDYVQYNYSIDIYTKGINDKGEEYSMKTVEPLVSDYTKKGFVKGIMSVTTKKGSKHLDYSKEGSNKEVDYKESNNNSSNNSDNKNSNNNSDNNNSNNNNSNNNNSNNNSENQSKGNN